MTQTIPAPPRISRRHIKQTSLSFSQEGLWFLQQLDPENNAYNLNYLVNLSGGIDRSTLERVLNELIRRHEPLRTIYPSQGGKPVQVIQPFEQFSLPFVDYSGLPEDELQQAIHNYVSEHGDQPFNLQEGPLVRFALLHTAREQNYLFFSTHHIGFDAWSEQVFFNEIMQFYNAFRSGKEPVLSELPIQYADYALWEREWLSGETLEAYIEHWKNIFSGELPILELPTDRPRPVLQSYRGARYHFQLPPGISSRMKEFCQTEHMTPFQLLLAAYALLLMRHTGQEDIIIGCPFANRFRPELDGLVGMFVNTLPIRVNLQGNPSVREFLDQVRVLMQDAFIWQAAPFGVLVSEISPQRDLSRMPVFQVVINLRNVPKRHTSVNGLKMESIYRDDAPSKFDLDLDFGVNENGDLDASLKYNVDLYDENTIIHMVAHYQNLLGQLLKKTDSSIADLEMLTPSEWQQIVIEWNDTGTDYPREKCIHQLFEEQVEHTPEAIAVVFEDQQLTYQELNTRANQLAHYLHSFGVGPDVLVGICMERSLEMVISLLGILKAGGAYVPLDPSYPSERLNFMVDEIRAPVIITRRSFASRLPVSSTRLVNLDDEWSLIEKQEDRPLQTVVSPDHLAYVIYTSGTTGKPKGVMNTHRGIVNQLVWTQVEYGLTAADTVLQKTPFSFDVSVWEFFWPLLFGARLVLARPGGHKDNDYLVKIIGTQHVTIIHFVPAMLQIFLDNLPSGAGTELRRVFSGGEVLPVELQDHFFSKLAAQLHNLYGPTEAAVEVTFWNCVRAENLTSIPIGRPISNIQIYILDRYLHPTPAGVPGELCIGGIGVARGYLNRPELTAEKFIPNPFSREPGTRLYKTGDLARWSPDGVIEYLGRMDNQVKLRGFRIELGEIETALGQHPGIHKAIVALREDRPGDKRLVAYVIPAHGVTLLADELRGFLREKLPAYMVPSAFVPMDAYPLTPNGKLDRHALPVPYTGTMEDKEHVAPLSRTEQTLVKIWIDVLGIPYVSVGDDFFDIGGNSLLAIQAIAHIQNELKVAVPISRFFEFPRLSELAAQVDFELLYQNLNSGSDEGINDREEYIL